MSKLVVLSNRVSMPNRSQEAGGLAVAVKEALERSGGIWCGWSGKITGAPEEHGTVDGNIRYRTLDFTQHEYDSFYLGFCNSVLWPLFHYRSDLMRYDAGAFSVYERVNARYAALVNAVVKPGDITWVHDYQLLTVARHMRQAGKTDPIGFFLHIPFPVFELFSALPVAGEILRAMCDYDLLGFQTETDVEAFLGCVRTMADGRIKRLEDGTRQVQAYGRTFKAGCFPIGIDTADMVETAAQAEYAMKTKQLSESLDGRSLLIGVDRLDYSKGLVQRLDGFQRFLERHKEFASHVSYVQITPPSRGEIEGYQEIREQLETRAARINGVNAEIDWVPIRYINKSFPRATLAGFYRTARVGLVTPLRDGMNLVAKEYVASQNPADPGVLILSQFAGAAHELDAALIVNPYDNDAVGDAIHLALTMRIAERRERHAAMMTILKRNDIHGWTRNFLQHLQPPAVDQSSFDVAPAYSVRSSHVPAVL